MCCTLYKQTEASPLDYKCYETICFHSPFHSRPPTHTYICVIYLGLLLLISHRFLLCFHQSYICLEPAVFGSWVFLWSASAAWTDIKILQTLSETTLCKRGWAWKAFEILSPWGLAVFDGTLPVAINDHFAASCFVLSESILFAITVDLCLIKKQCTALNLAVYIMEASRRGSFQTFAKDSVA